jgi:hypothetical protein
MLQYIEFKNERFKTKDNYNLLCDLTNNTIILCSNYKLMTTLCDEIINTVNGQAEYNDYWCKDVDINNAKLELCFDLQRIIDINGQKITLSLEPSIVYKAKDIKDIWFFDWIGNLPYKEFIYPITIFKGSQENWDEGLDEVYKYIVNDRYGCYDGKWVNLNENRTNI